MFGAVTVKFLFLDTGKRKMEESPNREPEAKLVKTGSESEYLSDLIVLGLPYKANENDVKDYFQQFGDLAMHEVFIISHILILYHL